MRVWLLVSLVATMAFVASPLSVNAADTCQGSICVGTPSGASDPDDKCAMINNAFASSAPRCVKVKNGADTYYVYALATNLNSPNGCRLGNVEALPRGTSPTIGIYRESNGNDGLQEAESGSFDTPIYTNCSPWHGP